MRAQQPIFEGLTKYLSQLDADHIGTWIIDRENDGTPEHPIQMPFVNYSELVHRIIDDVYEYNDANKDFGLNRYGEILERNGLEWGTKSMSEADVSQLDAQCECIPKYKTVAPDMEKFVEMCFDPNSRMNERLKEALLKMLAEEVESK